MPKFIVRESSGEFYKSVTADDIQAARRQLGTESAIAWWGYTIEQAPDVDMFKDMSGDWNSLASKQHY